MLSLTHQALEKFDNQHDFERMCADMLNELGYQNVTPIAPKGGSDGGRDITFTISDGTKGLACVTLRTDGIQKFKEDFHQRSKGDFQQYIFFTNQYLTAAQKLSFEKYCVNDLDASFMSYDVEALRSLLDSALKSIRKRYLHIDDDRAAKIRSQVKKILQYSDALAPNNYKDRSGLAEWRLSSPAGRELFYTLIDAEDDELEQVPEIGSLLLAYKQKYYSFSQSTNALTEVGKKLISRLPLNEFQFIHGWTIYFEYFLSRAFGNSISETRNIVAVNYGITYEDCENAYNSMLAQSEVSTKVEKIKSTGLEVGRVADQLMESLGLKPAS